MGYSEDLLNSIEIVAEGILKGISYDKTITCTVIDDSKKSSGEYLVSDGSMQFTAYTSDQSFYNGTTVYVTVPEGNYDNTKIIVSKKVNEDEFVPFLYQAPFANFLNITDNLYKGVKSEGLTANYSSEVKLYEISGTNLGYSDFSHFGIRADFKSWVSDLDCVSGDYGLKVVLTFSTSGIVGQDSVSYSRTLYLNTLDMIGNSYNFDSFYTQEKLFDISTLGDIVGIQVYFYQDNQFKDEDGNLIPYTEDNFPDNILNHNLFVQNIWLGAGYELSSYDSDFIQLYSFDGKTYINTEDNNTKNISLKWVHINEDGTCLNMEDNQTEDFEIRWYQYELGARSADEYSGTYWKRINDEENPKDFNYILNPNINKMESEQIKVIALYQDKVYNSNILTFTNEKEVVNDATIEALKALTLVCKDVRGTDNGQKLRRLTEGNYFIYTEGNNLIDQAESQIERIIECHLDLTSSGETDPWVNLKDGDSITWRIPNTNTMIISEYQNNSKDDFVEVTFNGQNAIDAIKGTFGIPYISYKIKNYYSSYCANNTIQCIVKKNDIEYSATKELSFGQAGTTGTNYTFVLDLDGNKNAITIGSMDSIPVTAKLYDTQNREQDLSDKEIDWKWFKGPATSHINISKNNNKATLQPINGLNINEIYILQAILKDCGDYQLIAYLPIPLKTNNCAYITGATQVIYLTDGQPLYYNNAYKVFDINGDEIVDNITWDDIDDMGTLAANASDNDRKKYNNLKSYLPAISDKEEYVLKPVSMYVDGLPAYAVQCKQNGSVIWTQPILIIQNRYPSAMINEWNGKELKMGENHILAQMLGAGKKEDDNSFSGVLIGNLNGKIASDTEPHKYTGVFGFDKGVMSYSFTDDGRATIGKATGSQLVFDGNKSTITSKAYNNSSNASGLKIDFDNGFISAKKSGKEIFKLSNENHYLKIQNLNNQILMNVGDNSYYLKSSNYKYDVQNNVTYTYVWLGYPYDERIFNRWQKLYGQLYYYNNGNYDAIDSFSNVYLYYRTESTNEKVEADGSYFDLQNGNLYINRGYINGDVILRPDQGIKYKTYKKDAYTNYDGFYSAVENTDVNLPQASLVNVLTDIYSNISKAQAIGEAADANAQKAASMAGDVAEALSDSETALDLLNLILSDGVGGTDTTITATINLGRNDSNKISLSNLGVSLHMNGYEFTADGGGWGSTGNLWAEGEIIANRDLSASDYRCKDNIKNNLFLYKDFFFNLQPVSFDFKDKEYGKHLGFIAQDINNLIKNTLIDNNQINLVKQIKTSRYEDQMFLSYNDFIPLNTYMIQEAYKEIESLKKEIKELKEIINNE